MTNGYSKHISQTMAFSSRKASRYGHKEMFRQRNSLARAIKVSLLVLLLVTFAAIQPVHSQDYPRKDIDLDSFVQDLFAVQDEEVNYEDLYESLYQLYAHPLNLNKADREELASVYILSEAQINNFLEYRHRNGHLLTIYELQAIPTFDLATIYRLLPFVSVPYTDVDARPLWQRIASEPNHYLILRYDQVLEQKKGFTEPDTSASGMPNQRYLGSPQRFYLRYRISHAKDFSIGFTAEKDAGEGLIWHPATRQYGADFFSGHISLQNKGRWKNILLGDYQLQFGQGLVLAAGFSPGKGSETITTVRRSNLGIRPYSSVLESGFFRGAAATYQYKMLELTGFYSQLRRDANVAGAVDSLDQQETYISSLQVTGFHRTARELAAKSSILEQNMGGNALYRSPDQNVRIGATFLYTQFSAPLQRSSTNYNGFEFSGKYNLVGSLNYSFNWQNINLFGEWARSQNGGVGGISGLVASLTSTIETAMLYRRYDRDFHSLYANAFSENTRSINERGIYWGIKIMPVKQVTINAYYDSFRFPWLKFRVDAPSQGYEYLARLSYKPSKTLLFYLQYREEQKQRNQPDQTSPVYQLADTRKRNYAINLDYAAAKSLSFKSRIQFSDFQMEQTRTSGYAMIQDVSLELGKWKVSTRFALFDTEDYENRQYVYEKDVLYGFSIPAYTDRGFRNYLLCQYQINRKVTCWVRWARTDLRNQTTIGSGLEQISGPHRTDVKVQIRYLF